MRHLNKIFAALLALSSGLGAFAKEKAREETVLLDKHRVTITVPEGYVYSSGRDDQGIIMAKLSDPKEKVDLQVRFQTDTGARLGGEAQQMEFLANVCRQYAESSV